MRPFFALLVFSSSLVLALAETGNPPRPDTPTPVPLSKQNPARQSPSVVGPVLYGRSIEGRGLEYYRVGSGPSARLLIGGLHGGYEGNTVELANRFLAELRGHPELVPSSVTLYLIPCANPDAFAAGSGYPSGRVNARGVDLNRNWDYRWEATAHTTRGTISGGDSPFSEPETRALRDLILRYRFDATVVYHSAANMVLSSEATDTSATLALTTALSEATGYPLLVNFPGVSITGAMIDWMSTQGLPAAEIELSSHLDIDWTRNIAAFNVLCTWDPPTSPPDH